MEETKLQNHSKKWEIGCRGANTTLSDDAKKTFGTVVVVAEQVDEWVWD